jgi:molybdopterin converting factor small subunit
MPVRVEVTYEMAKALGTDRFEVEAGTVADAVAAARDRFAGTGADFDELARRAAVAVNGVLVRHRERLGTELTDGDTVAFVKAAAGG